jgi:intein-encoded DNA endonuclease-like protein
MNRQSAGKSFAYILGVYLGDGCITNQSNRDTLVFKMNTIDYDFAVAVESALIELGYNPSIKKHENVKYTQGFIYHIASYTCHDLGLILREDTNNKTIIPEYVFNWPIENIKNFITGLMDSDGFVSHSKTQNKFCMGFKKTSQWVPEFHRLLNSIGIMTTGIRKDFYTKSKDRWAYLFNIKLKSWIKNKMIFNIARKNDRVNAYAKTILNDYMLDTDK